MDDKIENELIFHIKNKDHRKYRELIQNYPDKSFVILKSMLKITNVIDLEVLYALADIRNNKTLELFIDEFNSTLDNDIKDHLLSAIAYLGLDSSLVFLRKILSDLDDDLASVDYICIAQISEFEDDLYLIIDDFCKRKNDLLFGNLNISFEFFEKSSIEISFEVKNKMKKIRNRIG